MTRRILAAAVLSFGISWMASAQTPAAGAATTAQRAAEDAAFRQDALADTTAGLSKPQVLQHVLPRYTSDAQRAKVQGDAVVEIVVGTSGVVERARLVSSVDSVFGLDSETLKAAKASTFKPGMLNGKAVPVWTTLTMTFRIH